jgi:signal transduction histidine kinase
MASNAIGYLQQAALVVPGETIRVPVSTVASRIETAVQAFDQSIEVRTRSIESSSLPSSVAEVLFSAAMQALVNSVQHAGSGPSVARWLVVRGLSPQGLEIEVGDTGAGFVPDEVAQERLGLRVSIIERVSQAGGEVEIDSSPGDGTVVTVRWRSSRDGGER